MCYRGEATPESFGPAVRPTLVTFILPGEDLVYSFSTSDDTNGGLSLAQICRNNQNPAAARHTGPPVSAIALKTLVAPQS